MSAVLSPREWQQLSAYQDDRLNPTERAAVEANLADSMEWQQALTSLQHTRLALQHAPRRRAPRNFTLSENLVCGISPRAIQTSLRLRWGSAFSTALALLFLVLGFTLGGSPAAARVPQGEVAEKAEAVGTLPPSVTPIPIIIWGSPDMNASLYGKNSGMGGGGGVDGEANALNNSSEVTGSAMDENPVAPLSSGRAAPAPGSGSFSIQSAPTESAPKDLISSGASAVQGTGPILGIQPSSTPTAQAVASPVVGEHPSGKAIENLVSSSPRLWWFLSALLLVTGIVLAVLGWKPTGKGKKEGCS